MVEIVAGLEVTVIVVPEAPTLCVTLPDPLPMKFLSFEVNVAVMVRLPAEVKV